MHTRFHHALGALHLTGMALEVLRSKGHKITTKEAEAVSIAILLHDIGHGPYSHTLENCLIKGVHHEFISERFMDALNKQHKGRMTMAIEIFQDKYKKKFLHQLIASQLDMDRLDYLKRDSFFTGVYEGVIGHDRIIKMLDVKEDKLVVEQKGIYSIEKFLVARRLMYWQVYLHKTVICAEQMLVNILKRAKELANNGVEVPAGKALGYFLNNNITKKHFLEGHEALEKFAALDDYDVFFSVKEWAGHKDQVLSLLCRNLIERKLFKIELRNHPFAKSRINRLMDLSQQKYKLIDKQMAGYFVFSSETSNSAYDAEKGNIYILFKDGTLLDVAEASDQLNISVMLKPVKKYYLCYPKGLAVD